MADLNGKVFGRFTVISSKPIPNCRHTKWKCKCECGRVKDLYQSRLVRGKYNKGCGCWAYLGGPSRTVTHGLSKEPIYQRWCYLVSRYRKHAKSNPSVVIPLEWLFSFDRFLSDMGPRKATDKFLARKDDSLPYSAENCCWTSVRPKAAKVRS